LKITQVCKASILTLGLAKGGYLLINFSNPDGYPRASGARLLPRTAGIGLILKAIRVMLPFRALGTEVMP
jgi:hypothetical protein